MSKYAADTSVSSERSRAEIETTLRRYGADRFAYMSERTRAVIGFEANNRRIRVDVPLPDPKAREFTHTPARGTPSRQRGSSSLSWHDEERSATPSSLRACRCTAGGNLT